MGVPDGAHTHGSGGSGLGPVVLVLLAMALLGPAVTAAAAELLHLVLIVSGVIAGAAVLGGGGLLARRWHHRPQLDAARTTPPLLYQKVVRAAPPLPLEQRPAPQLPAAPTRELPGGLHFHFHFISMAARPRTSLRSSAARPARRSSTPGGQETINEINETQGRGDIAVNACGARQVRVASDAPPGG
jgi:hypothetical protein